MRTPCVRLAVAPVTGSVAVAVSDQLVSCMVMFETAEYPVAGLVPRHAAEAMDTGNPLTVTDCGTGASKAALLLMTCSIACCALWLMVLLLCRLPIIRRSALLRLIEDTTNSVRIT